MRKMCACVCMCRRTKMNDTSTKHYALFLEKKMKQEYILIQYLIAYKVFILKVS